MKKWLRGNEWLFFLRQLALGMAAFKNRGRQVWQAANDFG